MHDLRKKILLESGKTVSRKARARPESGRSSAVHTPTTSPGHSTAGSRYASEDEDYSGSDDYDDVMTVSTNSLGEDQDGEAAGTVAAWPDRLRDRIAEMTNLKRSSVQGREAALNAYLHLLRHHYAKSIVDVSFADIMTSLVRSIRSGDSADERTLAMRALNVTVLTCPSNNVYDRVFQTLKTVCEDNEEEKVKVAAIQSLSASALYGGGDPGAYDEVLQFLVEIIESDGGSVDAQDNGAVVTAALQAWGLVASYVPDLLDQADQAMDAFMEQLDSTDADVQTGAGSNIAQLFEAARQREEETGEKFDMQYNQHRIMTRMAEIVRESSKAISKRDRRHLRSSFTSIVTSLERGKGPGYSTARKDATADPDGELHHQEFGYREKLRVHDQLMVIDSWSLQARVEGIKALLAGGFPIHFMDNPLLEEILADAEVEQLASAVDRKYKKRDIDEGHAKKGRKATRATEVF
ncbi:interferon-related developmental regulator-domain-containing protein [Coniochaeta sp. 2T2.1]|nr:interferon-related developmental regulator-domain-containing protein [Coniochaeta sp. 2T2.1]